MLCLFFANRILYYCAVSQSNNFFNEKYTVLLKLNSISCNSGTVERRFRAKLSKFPAS